MDHRSNANVGVPDTCYHPSTCNKNSDLPTAYDTSHHPRYNLWGRRSLDDGSQSLNVETLSDLVERSSRMSMGRSSHDKSGLTDNIYNMTPRRGERHSTRHLSRMRSQINDERGWSPPEQILLRLQNLKECFALSADSFK